jgi:3-deoxy-D-manno-octulosonic acid kinase
VARAPHGGLSVPAEDYEDSESSAGVLRVRREWAAALRPLALLEPGALERWLAAAEAGGTGRAATASIAIPAGPRVIVRRLRHGGLLGPLLGGRYLGPGRVLRELEATARLRAAGAPVPEPVLALALRRGVCWALAIATVHEEGAVDALEFFAARPDEARLLRAAAAAGAALRRFHDAGGRHADLHVKNLLLRETRAGCDVIVIDLDRGRAGAPPGPRRRAREIGRLWRSLLKRGVLESLGERGAAAFVSAYCAGDRGLREALGRFLPAERRKARLHALHYR